MVLVPLRPEPATKTIDLVVAGAASFDVAACSS